MFFKKRKEECPHKEFTQTCFKKVSHTIYGGGYSMGKSEWESWDEVKSSGRYVETPTKIVETPTKMYEVLVDGKVTWINSTELKWPKC